MAITSFSLIFISLWVTIQSDCSYVDIKQGLGFPTDTCIYRSTDNGINSSTLFHCTRSAIETHQFDNYNCDGTPSTKSSAMLTEYDYQCGANNSPDECNTATLTIHSCNSYNTNSHSTLILITNECFNAQNVSYRAQCSGNNNGNIFQYNSLDCEGAATKYDFFEQNDWDDSTTTTYSPYCNRLTWQCDTHVYAWTTQSVALIIAGLLICLLFVIICSYCFCCKTKKPNMNNKSEPLIKNNYVAMENVPYIESQSNHSNVSGTTNAPQVVQVLQYEDVLPSAPKMSSVNNEKIEQLPYGWNKAVTNDGKVYYQNNITKETQWKRPTKITNITAEGGPNLNRIETNGLEGGGIVSLIENKEYGGVVEFVMSCGFVDDEDTHKYIKLFVLNGYDASFKISQLTDQQLIDIGVNKFDHRRKILEEASKI